VSVIQKNFLDPQKRVDLAVADLARRVKFSGLVTVVDGEVFEGTTDGSGNPTIWYETEATTVARDYEWRARTKPVQFDDIFTTRLPIKLNKHITQGVRTTPEQEAFDEVSYARDVLPPATRAVANKLNAKIESALLTGSSDWKTTNLTLGGGTAAAWNEERLVEQLIEIQLACDAQGMPQGGRKLVAGKNVYTKIAASKSLRAYDLTAATTVFRRGVRGYIEVADMELVNGVGLLGDNDFLVLHPSWAVMPTHRGEMPDPSFVTWARAASVDGFSIRIQRGYDLNFDRNGQVIHTYWNIEQIKDEIQRHTRQTAASANDGSEAGDPVITDDALVTTGKNVRIAKGTWTNPTA
jgi:hypothetical protein